MRIKTAKAIENASPTSMMKGGIGRKKTERMAMMPAAKPRSLPPFPSLSAGASAAAMLHPSPTRGGSIAHLDARIDLLGKDIHLPADERGRQSQRNEHDDDFRHEGQRHLLDLRQRLEKRDAESDDHSRTHGRPRDDDDRPDCRTCEFERVRFVHGYSMVTPTGKVNWLASLSVVLVAALLPVVSEIVLPSLNVPVTLPSEARLTETIVPVVLPSAEVTVCPIICSACVSAVEVSKVSSFELVWICCSTCENDASWLIY